MEMGLLVNLKERWSEPLKCLKDNGIIIKFETASELLD